MIRLSMKIFLSIRTKCRELNQRRLSFEQLSGKIAQLFGDQIGNIRSAVFFLGSSTLSLHARIHEMATE